MTEKMDTEDFLNCLRLDEVPPLPPQEASPYGTIDHYLFNKPLGSPAFGEARSEATETHWMWAIVDMFWTKVLAEWIGDRTVLEVMAGRGWLSKALLEHNIQMLPTDNMEWRKHYCEPIQTMVCNVLQVEAEEAVECADEEILIVSWPPYLSDTILRVCDKWGPDRPIVYIGEGEGGCNAPDDFFHGFKGDKDAPEIPLLAWPGIHDYVEIGYWKP